MESRGIELGRATETEICQASAKVFPTAIYLLVYIALLITIPPPPPPPVQRSFFVLCARVPRILVMLSSRVSFSCPLAMNTSHLTYAYACIEVDLAFFFLYCLSLCYGAELYSSVLYIICYPSIPTSPECTSVYCFSFSLLLAPGFPSVIIVSSATPEHIFPRFFSPFGDTCAPCSVPTTQCNFQHTHTYTHSPDSTFSDSVLRSLVNPPPPLFLISNSDLWCRGYIFSSRIQR